SGVAIFDLDYDAILAAMYDLSASTEGGCYLCVPPDPGIDAAALGASESVLPGTAPAEALQTFTLDSGASRCFFRNNTTLTPLSSPVQVRLADPFEGPVLTRSSIVLPCLVVPSSSLWSSQVSASPPALACPALPSLRRRAAARHSSLLLGSPDDCSLTDSPHGHGILQSFTLPDSPRQNRIAERRIGLVMEVTRTSMIHAVAPHFLWPFAVRYAAHQLNLWPHVSSQETSPTLRWTGKFGDASVFQIWGSRAPLRPSHLLTSYGRGGV
ncbi:unnamed protein product, partial [Closterium sp. NIES-53]